MRKLKALALFALLAAGVTYALRRFLGADDSEWQTIAAGSASTTPKLYPEKTDPAHDYDDVEAALEADAGGAASDGADEAPTPPPSDWDPLTDPLPDELREQ